MGWCAWRVVFLWVATEVTEALYTPAVANKKSVAFLLRENARIVLIRLQFIGLIRGERSWQSLLPWAYYSALSPGGATVISRAPNRHASMYPGSLTAQNVSRTSGRCSRLTDSSPTAS
jgi:hypothetical protein